MKNQNPFSFSFWSVVTVVVALLCLPVLALGDADSSVPPGEGVDWAKAQRFWSFRAPVARARPAVKNEKWPRQPLDYFILNRLERKQLTPSPEADRATLIRRLTFDLTGLPPTPEEVEAFRKDTQPGAYERLVDRLLASPRFGERMASLWLPLARYAEDQAHQVGDDTTLFYPNAYKYRDWVIQAFNRDLPYTQFIRFQLAADKLQPAGAPEDLAALGFLGLGPKYYDRRRLEVMSDEWEDRVDAVTRTFLGLTVSCARCHDHKFDPITTRDYYALAGVFASTKMVNRKPDGQPEQGKVSAEKMDPGTLHVVEDGTVTNLNVFVRGDVTRKGPVVERRFLRVLSQSEPPPFQEGSGRRELADAIASPTNSLTARVLVNRVWGLLFGRPLVLTPSNFGRLGEAPSHPELLDHLAIRFVQQGWSVKRLVRELALSATYRQSSRLDAKKAKVDAPNVLLWRMNRRRLTIEQWRDSVLFVSGELKSESTRSAELDDPTNLRRTVYARISRLRLNDLLAQFDFPDANVHAEKRAVTTTPTQKLFILNSPFMLARAKALAARLMAEPGTDDRVRVLRAYSLLFNRAPDDAEMKLALGFLKRPSSEKARMTRWEQYAQILLASNEMLYQD
jgi:hypothetical protein